MMLELWSFIISLVNRAEDNHRRILVFRRSVRLGPELHPQNYSVLTLDMKSAYLTLIQSFSMTPRSWLRTIKHVMIAHVQYALKRFVKGVIP